MMPAVEGLLRHGLLRGRFPAINSVVDGANIVSLRNLVPIGVFDADRIDGDIELASAAAGDSFVPIGKDSPIQLNAGVPVLRDRQGIFSAVGSRDSRRTMILPETRNVLVFSWGAEGLREEEVAATLDQCEEAMTGTFEEP